ncbi:MAG: hypothetical protein GY806_08865 [Gammaproteobacteria bacterium]|nr:hypothetical protein [Gammaproteobacteria bacterium]
MSRLSRTVILLIPLMFSGVTLTSDIVFAADNIRDPMQPPAFALKQFRLAKNKRQGAAQAKLITVKKTPEKQLRLSTVLIGKARKVAIINDRMLVVGDKIKNAKVLRILKDSVELVRNGKRIKLVLDNRLISVRKKSVKSNL